MLRLNPYAFMIASMRVSAPKNIYAMNIAASNDNAPDLGALHLSPMMVPISISIGIAERTILVRLIFSPLASNFSTPLHIKNTYI